MTVREPRCLVCGCPHGAHGEDGMCRTQRVSGWDDKKKSFTSVSVCTCTGYRGAQPPPPSSANCPHEFLPKGENPNRCIHCRKIVTEEERHDRSRRLGA